MNQDLARAELVDQVGDIAASAGAIGAHFSSAVSALFGLDGMRDLGRRLVDCVPEAMPYLAALDVMHANIQEHILDQLPEVHRKEARSLATVMSGRQSALHERIARSA